MIVLFCVSWLCKSTTVCLEVCNICFIRLDRTLLRPAYQRCVCSLLQQEKKDIIFSLWVLRHPRTKYWNIKITKIYPPFLFCVLIGQKNSKNMLWTLAVNSLTGISLVEYFKQIYPQWGVIPDQCLIFKAGADIRLFTNTW